VRAYRDVASWRLGGEVFHIPAEYRTAVSGAWISLSSSASVVDCGSEELRSYFSVRDRSVKVSITLFVVPFFVALRFLL